jgi:hypothetical protein
MPILTTVLVTPSITLLYGAKGSNSGPLQVVNLSNSVTLYLATTANPSPSQAGTFPLAPLASLAFDGSVAIYGVTDGSGNVIAGIVPGGEGFSPGSLAISGPVTATISGPVTVNGNVGIVGTPSVNVANTPNVNVANTASVNIANTPAVTVASGSVAVTSVSGTIDVSGSTVDITTGNVNATGVGGFILPGSVASLYSNVTNQAIAPGASLTLISLTDVSNYNSYDMVLSVNDGSQAVLNHAHAYKATLQWFDDLVTGIPVFTETWYPWIGNAANAMPCTATGPMHGKYFTVILSSAAAVTGNITVNQALIFGSGRTTNLSEWRQQANAKSDNAAHILVNNSSVTDNMLADTNGMSVLTANLSYVMFLGLYTGPMDWAMQIGAGGGLTRSNLVTVGSAFGVQTSGNLNPQVNSLEILGTAVGSQNAGSQFMPRSAVALLVTVGAANTTMEFTAVAQQGP